MTFEQFLKDYHNIHVCDDEFWNSTVQANISSVKICELAEEWKLMLEKLDKPTLNML